MEKREEEKNHSGPEDSLECLVSIREKYTPPSLQSMSLEERKAFLDDLFFSDLFSDG
jgi:hypothetical protein